MLSLPDIEHKASSLTNLPITIRLKDDQLVIETPSGENKLAVVSEVGTDVDIEMFSNRYLKPMIWMLESKAK